MKFIVLSILVASSLAVQAKPLKIYLTSGKHRRRLRTSNPKGRVTTGLFTDSGPSPTSF